MSEHFRPVIEKYSWFETVYLPEVEAAIARFKENPEPVSLWATSQATDRKRAERLSVEEIERAIAEILSLCGVGKEFLSKIVELKDNSISGTIQKVDGLKHNPANPPTIFQIFEWLADKDSWLCDEPDYAVGFTIESDVGLVVVKQKMEELLCLGEAWDESMIGVEHLMGRVINRELPNEYVFDYQVSLFPKNDRGAINYEASQYGTNP